MNENRAPLSYTLGEITSGITGKAGTVDLNLPQNEPLINTLTDEQLKNYFSGKLQIMNLPASALPEGAEPIMAGNLAELKQRTLQGLITDADYALSLGRTVPVEVLTFINQV